MSTVTASADATSPLCFKAKNGSVSVRFDIKKVTHVIQYSTDSSNWFTYISNNSISLLANQKIYFRAATNQTTATAFGDSDTLNCSRFHFDSSNGGMVEGSGNIMSLYGPNCPNLPLKNRAFSWMFYDCSLLTTAPELAATTLDTCCYDDMFKNCSMLSSAPVLPATTLVSECYAYMFKGCTSLINAPLLPATNIATGCYNSMFRDCTSLVIPPSLPATTLMYGCYHDMFRGCYSLERTPLLPATNLDEHCYERMFYYCTSLTSLPVLPAATLPSCCYYRMFWGCSGLEVNTNGSGQQWKINAISAEADATSGMFHGTSGTMTGAPSINTTYYVASAQYIVTATVNDSTMGSVTGGGVYPYGSTATITAIPAANNHFVCWSNGVSTATTTIVVNADTSITAIFARDIITYNLTVNVNDPSMGSVKGGGTYNEGTTATLTATPAANHHFVRWSNGDLTATTTIVVTSDSIITATFAKDSITYIVTVYANDPSMGSVNGGGIYHSGSTAVLTATPAENHHFVNWSNGKTTSTISIVVSKDSILTANFTQDGTKYNVVVFANDPTMGNVNGGGTYYSGATATLTATPAENHHFVRWSNGETTSTISFVVTMDTALTAYFDSNDKIYSVTALANYADRGTVTGSGQYGYNSVATFSATPNSGFVFDGWSNGEKNQVIYITVVSDTVVKAIFNPESTAVEDIEDIEYVVYAEGNQIVVDGATEVFIYDAAGKSIFNGKTESEMQRFAVPAAGIYFVRVDEKKNYRIVVK